MATKALDIIIGAQDQASAVFEKVGKSLKGLKKDAAEAEGGGGGGLLSGLKSGLGRGSTFGLTANILRGAGPIIGLTIVGRELTALADKVVALKKDFDDSSKSAGQVGEELAKSIPIYGNIIAAGRTFRTVIDGTANDLEKIAKQDVIGKALQFRIDRLQETRKLVKELDDSIAATKNKSALVGLVDPEKSITEFRQQQEEIRKKANEQIDATKQSISSQYAKPAADLERQIREAAEKYQAAQEEVDARAVAMAKARAVSQLAYSSNADPAELRIKAGQYIDATHAYEEAKRTAADAKRERDALESTLASTRRQQQGDITSIIGKQKEKTAADLDLIERQVTQVQDAANQVRERHELEHWQTINKIQTEGQQKALTDQQENTAAAIAGQQGAYRAATAAAAQTFRESLREALHGGSVSPAKVVADFLQEGFERRGQYDTDIRRTVAVGIGQSIAGGFNDSIDFLKGKLDNWPQKLLYAAGLVGPANLSSNTIPTSVRTAGAPREARFLTGAGSVENRTARDSLAEQKKQTSLLTKISQTLVVNTGDEPAFVFN